MGSFLDTANQVSVRSSLVKTVAIENCFLGARIPEKSQNWQKQDGNF